jgi:nitroreductase
VAPASAGAGARADATELAAGGALRTLLLGLHAHGVATAFAAAGPEARATLATALGLPPGSRPLGLLGAGRPDPDPAGPR